MRKQQPTMNIKIGKFTYRVNLHGEGKALLCLHGFSESGQTFDKLNVPGYRVYAIDLLGHGESSKPREAKAYQFENIIKQLDMITTIIAGNEPYAMLGYSMGGRLAQQFALVCRPSGLESLIIESASPGIKQIGLRMARYEQDEALAKKIKEYGIQWFADYWEALPIFTTQKSLPEEERQLIRQRRLANKSWALANTLTGTGQGVLPYAGDYLGQLTCQTLYIAGELDAKYNDLRQKVYERYNTISTVAIPKVGHNTHIEDPKTFNEIVTTFLATTNGVN